MLVWFAFWGAVAGVVLVVVDQAVASFLRRVVGDDSDDEGAAVPGSPGDTSHLD